MPLPNDYLKDGNVNKAGFKIVVRLIKIFI